MTRLTGENVTVGFWVHVGSVRVRPEASLMMWMMFTWLPELFWRFVSLLPEETNPNVIQREGPYYPWCYIHSDEFILHTNYQ